MPRLKAMIDLMSTVEDTIVQNGCQQHAGSVNPLSQLLAVAMENLRLASQNPYAPDDGLALAPWSERFPETAFPMDADGRPVYDSVKLAGEASLYAALKENDELEVLLTGALALQLHGIDAIARIRSSGILVICEAKGTQNPITQSLSYYLHMTRHKGRQLSKEWCWKSLVDMADHPSTALAFLELLEPMLEGRFERLMAVTQVQRQEGGFTLQTRRIFREARLQEYPPLTTPYDLTRQRKMWQKIPEELRQSLNELRRFVI